MNFLQSLFGLSVLLIIQKISGDGEETYRTKSTEPLALIQIKDPGKRLELKLATPHRVLNYQIVAGYSYDEKDERGLVQEFKTACPAYTSAQKKIQRQWRRNNKADATRKSSLFFLEEYTGWKMECQVRSDEVPVPSIRRTTKECANSQGYIYEVGYPVSLSTEHFKNIQFMAVYELCYSKVDSKKGVIYTKHRIDWPSLLLLKIHQKYEPEPWNSFRSPIDRNLGKVQREYERKHIYQFVPRYDMPTLLWENTTLFPFNYISGGGRNSYTYNLFRGMLKFDYFVRLVSRENNKKFTIYTGPHQRPNYEIVPNCWGIKKRVWTPIISVWKVIIDEENYATMLVTQITKMKCGITEKTEYLCSQDIRVLEDYKGGGCTYKCSVDTKVLESLPLPKLHIKGKLDLSYTEPVKQESKENTNGEEGQEGQFDSEKATSSPKKIDITDFGTVGAGYAFMAALEGVDATTTATMESAGAVDSAYSNSDGGGYYVSSDVGFSDVGTGDMGAAM